MLESLTYEGPTDAEPSESPGVCRVYLPPKLRRVPQFFGSQTCPDRPK
jgi:hypothetical protein